MTKDPDYWDRKLSMDYPLVPGHIRKMGIDKNAYLDQNNKLGKYREKMMLEVALPELKKRNPDRGGVMFLGIGLGRGLRCVGSIIKEGFGVNMYDMSGVACQNARRLFSPLIWFNLSFIIPAEIISGWNSGLIDEEGAVAYVAFQFIQIQDRKTMRWMMRHLGSFLKGDGVLYLDHPLGDDEENRDLRKWGDTIPYTIRDLRAPIEKGLGHRAKIEVRGQHMYFDQKYSFIQISKSDE